MLKNNSNRHVGPKNIHHVQKTKCTSLGKVGKLKICNRGTQKLIVTKGKWTKYRRWTKKIDGAWSRHHASAFFLCSSGFDRLNEQPRAHSRVIPCWTKLCCHRRKIGHGKSKNCETQIWYWDASWFKPSDTLLRQRLGGYISTAIFVSGPVSDPNPKRQQWAAITITISIGYWLEWTRREARMCQLFLAQAFGQCVHGQAFAEIHRDHKFSPLCTDSATAQVIVGVFSGSSVWKSTVGQEPLVA